WLIVLTATALVVASPVAARTEEPSVAQWAARHAVPLRTTDPTAPDADLAPLRGWLAEANVGGLGESVHRAGQEVTLKARGLRFLVQRMGFRTIAWEEDWTTGVRIDRYLRTGNGDPVALAGQMSPQWPSREVADVLRWLRGYNATHRDDVRFVGIDFYLLGRL